MQPDDTATPFQGFRSPRYTQVPDELFDELLPTLSGAELKILLYIIRRTFGFKREADAISLSQMMTGITTRDGHLLDRGVGLDKPTLLAALRSLVTRNIIETERRRSAERGDEPTVYRLRFAEGDAVLDTSGGGGNEDDIAPPPVVKKFDQGVVKKLYHPVVKKSYPQETERQTEGQQTEKIPSNLRRSKNANHFVDNFVDNSAPVSGSSPHVDNAVPLPVTPSPRAPGNERSIQSHATQTPLPTIVARNDNGTDGIIAIEADGTTEGGERRKQTVRRGRPLGNRSSDERSQISAYIRDFAPQLGDQAPLASSVTRAYNLYLASGLPIARFIDALYQARTRTREHSAGIRTSLPSDDQWGAKPKMAYFFSVLQDEVSLHDE